MTSLDARGEALSTGLPSSVAAYEAALDLFNGLRLDPVEALRPALERDPDFISGHLMMAGFMLAAFDGQALGAARDSLAAASASRHRPNEREGSLREALAAWAGGDMARGNRLLDRHLIDHPRDLFALQLTHMSDLVLGQPGMLRDRIGRVLGQWSPDDPGYGYVLGMHAFGLEECNEYARAEARGRQALALNPHDTWAVHAVAHVCEMQGRVEEGIRWLTIDNRLWPENNMLAVHNHWHLALLHLQNGDTASALAVYDRAISPGPAAVVMDLADASALLWRLGLRGVGVDERWQVLADRWHAQASWGWSVFNDIHALLSFVGAGSSAPTVAAREAIATAPAGTPGPWWNQAATLCEAVIAFGDGRYAECVERLHPLLQATQGFGGSQAQRSLIHLTVTEAARRAGDEALWVALSGEAAARRKDAPVAGRRPAPLRQAA